MDTVYIGITLFGIEWLNDHLKSMKSWFEVKVKKHAFGIIVLVLL